MGVNPPKQGFFLVPFQGPLGKISNIRSTDRPLFHFGRLPATVDLFVG